MSLTTAEKPVIPSYSLLQNSSTGNAMIEVKEAIGEVVTRDPGFLILNMVNPGYTATEFNRHRGVKKVEDAASIIVQYAMLDENGPTGKFVSDYGETPW